MGFRIPGEYFQDLNGGQNGEKEIVNLIWKKLFLFIRPLYLAWRKRARNTQFILIILWPGGGKSRIIATQEALCTDSNTLWQRTTRG